MARWSNLGGMPSTSLVEVRTEVEEAEGAEHGYFNDYWEHFASSLASVDRFLASLGFLDGPPRIRV